MSLTESESIRKFYDGTEIFITGGSGFIGKVLIEKLLRSCARVKTIYLLMRAKKGTTAAQRIHELSDCMLFDALREQDCEAVNKLQVIEGDVMKLNLGISESDVEKLKTCSIIFHAAASVRFDDPLKSAILLNTRGTREVCELARKMPKLKALMHVSTAYIQPKNLYVREMLYPTDADWKTYIKYAENLDDDVLNCLTLKLTNFAPNTYTFTKHMAEAVCVDYKMTTDLPIIIYRPSIVSITESDPFCGWCDNLNGPMGLTFVGALGLNHVMNVDGSNKMDVVPVDICAKSMIIAVWKKAVEQRSALESSDIPVYNATSIKILSYTSFVFDLSQMLKEIPSVHMFGLPGFTFSTCTLYCWLIRLFRNIIPALIVDGILRLVGNKKLSVMKLQRIIYNSDNSLHYFTHHIFKFDNFNFLDLNKLIPEHEKEDFDLSEKVTSHRDLFFNGFKVGLKVLIGETDKDAEIARKRYPYVYFITRTIQLMFSLTVLKICHVAFKRFVNY